MKICNKEVEIQVDDIEPFVNDVYTGFKILWSGNIGWGEYTIYKINGEDKWYADSEHMDNPKGEYIFLDMLLKDFMKQIEVKE